MENEEWTAHQANGFTFFTGNSVTLLSQYQENPEKARQRWLTAHEKNPLFVLWQWERAENHAHQKMSLPERELTFKEWVYARELSDALRQAFPARRFIVSWIPAYAVSFYGFEEGMPGTGVDVLSEPKDTVFCVTCQNKCAFTLTANPDPDIPVLRWARCAVCETDCLQGDYEVRFRVTE